MSCSPFSIAYSAISDKTDQDTGAQFSYPDSRKQMQYLRSLYNILEIEPCQDSEDKICQDLAPEHILK